MVFPVFLRSFQLIHLSITFFSIVYIHKGITTNKMDITIVKYNTKHLNNKQKIDFSLEVFGYTDKSNNNQYKYIRKGSITDVISDKLGKSAFLIQTKDEKKVIKEMYKYKIPLELIKIILKKK